MQFLATLFQSLSAYALPTACIVCQRYQAENVCVHCMSKLRANGLAQFECCVQCGTPLLRLEVGRKHCGPCHDYPPHYDRTQCLDIYNGILQDAVHQLKYQNRISFAHGLAYAWDQIQTSRLNLIRGDFLLPVPLSNEKLLKRGFNQSWEIARRLRCASAIPKLTSALKRYHYPHHQAGKSLAERQRAVQKMFYIDPQYIAPLRNKTVIVFDDVMTSGATLNEIARTLKSHGVSQVINWVLLRTSRLAR